MKGPRWDSREMRPSAQNEQLQFYLKLAKHFLTAFRDTEAKQHVSYQNMANMALCISEDTNCMAKMSSTQRASGANSTFSCHLL